MRTKSAFVGGIAGAVLGGVLFASSGAHSSPLLGSPSEPQEGAREGGDARVSAEAVPFLWRVEGQGATAFLYGTIHLPDPRVLKLSPVVEAAFEQSDTFFAEIEATEQSKRSVQALATMEGGRIDQLVGPEVWTRIVDRFAAHGHPKEVPMALGAYKPWVFGALVSNLEYLEAQMQGQMPLDEALYQRAARAKKTVGGLESVSEQVAAFEVFSLNEQLSMLKDTLDQLDEYEAKGRNALQEMVSAWLSGNAGELMELLDDGFGRDPELKARAEDSILWDRNRRMATRIAQRMKEHPAETTFFAVGALHLPDARVAPLKDGATPEEAAEHARLVAESRRKLGVVTLLEKRGMRVTRMRADESAAVPAGAGSGGGR